MRISDAEARALLDELYALPAINLGNRHPRANRNLLRSAETTG
jgi:acetylornithine/succinyldiaminopimelate/putrescine aminotransferase